MVNFGRLPNLDELSWIRLQRGPGAIGVKFAWLQRPIVLHIIRRPGSEHCATGTSSKYPKLKIESTSLNENCLHPVTIVCCTAHGVSPIRTMTVLSVCSCIGPMTHEPIASVSRADEIYKKHRRL